MFKTIKDGNCLLVGCGGGYDIFCGIPLYLYRQQRNAKQVTLLLNYSFTNQVLLERGKLVAGSLYEIDAKTFTLPTQDEFVKEVTEGKDVPEWLLKQLGITKVEYNDSQCNGTSPNGKLYFPEYELSRELGVPVYAYHGEKGGIGIYEGITALVNRYNISTIVAVDGGTDSLMYGDERVPDGNSGNGLGTPHEDMLTLAVLNLILLENDLQSYLYILGYNIDLMHGVGDQNVQNKILDQIKWGGFLGAEHLLNYPLIAKSYIDIFKRCSPENSWINSLVCASLEGQTERLVLPRGVSRVPTSPFMSIYFGFRLDTIVKGKLWDMEAIALTTSDAEVCELISKVPGLQ